MPSVSVNAPKTPVTKGSSTVAAATLPNMCKMPGPPAPFVPTPLPNIARSAIQPKGFSKSVKVEGHVVAIKGASFGSQGDVASKATGGGVASANTHGPAKFVGPGSINVKIEGKNIHLLADPMVNNCGPSGSPANSATLAGAAHLVSGVWVVYEKGKGDLNCPHPNVTRSDPAENDRKRRHLDQKGQYYSTKKEAKLRKAVKFEIEGNYSLSEAMLGSALKAEKSQHGVIWEQKIAADEQATEQSIDYYCPDCGMQGEYDCMTKNGRLKDAKHTGKAAKYRQFERQTSIAAVLFPGTPVHIAVPRDEARNVASSFPESCVQRH